MTARESICLAIFCSQLIIYSELKTYKITAPIGLVENSSALRYVDIPGFDGPLSLEMDVVLPQASVAIPPVLPLWTVVRE